MARKAKEESQWDQEEIVCSSVATTMSPLSWRVALWEEQNKEAIAIIKRFESQLKS